MAYITAGKAKEWKQYGTFSCVVEAGDLQVQRTSRSKYAELTRSLPPRENIAIDRRPDVDDEAVLAAEREIQVRAFDRGATLLRNVIAALRRIENGTYGICDGCGQRIGRKRLDAVPWAAFCLKCQQELEQQALDRGVFSEAA